MSEILGSVLSVAFLLQLLRIAVPYTLAALGGTLSERSGVINIALEGKLLLGAFAGAVGAIESGSALVGALAGLGGGVLVAALYALVVVRWSADQIVAGVAVNLLALGLTRYLLKLFYGSTANSPPAPGFGGALVSNPLFWAAVLLVGGIHLLLARTRYGLRARAAGEHPAALASLGVSVARVRWTAVLGAGALAGLGGAFLALDNQGFVAAMSGGRGYIALAAVIMGKWRPGLAAAACLLFAAAEALQVNLQALDVGVPRELVQILPYLLTMVALAGFIGRSRAPAALGEPHDEA